MTAPAVKRADSLVDSVGVDIHVAYFNTPYNNFETLVRPMLNGAGFRHIRDGIAAPSGDSPANKQLFNSRMAELAGDGIKFSQVVPDGTSDVAFDLTQLLAQYQATGSGAIYFEGGNEPNVSGTQNWQTISKTYQTNLYNTVKTDPTMGPAVQLIGPGLTGTGAPPISIGDLSALTDQGNWHPYSGGLMPEDMNLRDSGDIAGYLYEASNVYGSHPIIATEIGYTSAMQQSGITPTPLNIITRYLPRLYLWNYLLGMPRTYVYQLIDDHAPSQTDPEANFGMVDYSGNAKSSYTAVKNLIAMFSDRTPFTPTQIQYHVQYQFGRNIQSALFEKSNGHYLIPVWLAEAGWDRDAQQLITVPPQATTVMLPSTVTSVTVHQFADDGSVTDTVLTPSAGVLNLTVTDSLAVLEFTP